jgi:competence protein ComEC
LEKLELDKKVFFIIALVLILLFFANLFSYYQNFKKLTSSKYYQTTLKVTAVYPKRTKTGKMYKLLRLKMKNGIYLFGITWQKNLPNLQGRSITCKISVKKLTFFKYLKGGFLPVYHIKILSNNSNDIKRRLKDFISSQHKDKVTKEIFTALFLGKNIDKNLRKQIALLGISHLIAISGFHLGVLSFLIFLVLTPIYKFFQDRFFPYRNRMFDLIIISMLLLLFYLYILGFIPSLVRAYVMMVVGYIFYIRYINILSFQTLLLTLLILLAFFPELVFSIAFWFSVCGVFYIFLFLHYFEYLKPWQIFIVLNFWVYLLMQPIVHFVFPVFALSQLLSPFLSMAFVLFYPLELILHILNLGYLLDKEVLKLLEFKAHTIELKTPLWFMGTYITTSLLSIYKKIFLYLLLLQSAIFFVILLISNF